MMRNRFKVLLVLMLVLSLCCLFVACSDNDNPPEPSDTDQNTPVTPSIDAMINMDNIKEVNIYLNGVKNTLSLDDNISTLLVEGLGDTLLAAIKDNGMIADNSGKSIDDLTKATTCLEIVYAAPVDLPFIQDNEHFTANKLLYAIHAGQDAENILAVNEAIFGAIADNNLAGMIEDYVLNNLQTTQFNGDQVTVAGITTTYLKEQSDDIAEPLLSQLLYNALAFYQNCYNQDFESNKTICTEELNIALDSGSEVSTGHGEDIILNMSKYFEYAVPVSVQAVYDGHYGDYIVYINIDNITTLSIVFVDVNGYPYIDACHLMSV